MFHRERTNRVQGDMCRKHRGKLCTGRSYWILSEGYSSTGRTFPLFTLTSRKRQRPVYSPDATLLMCHSFSHNRVQGHICRHPYTMSLRIKPPLFYEKRKKFASVWIAGAYDWCLLVVEFAKMTRWWSCDAYPDIVNSVRVGHITPPRGHRGGRPSRTLFSKTHRNTCSIHFSDMEFVYMYYGWNMYVNTPAWCDWWPLITPPVTAPLQCCCQNLLFFLCPPRKWPLASLVN